MSTSAYALENMGVLIVEDNSYMQLLLKEIMRSFRIRNFRTASDGVNVLKTL